MKEQHFVTNKYLKLENTYADLPEKLYSRQDPDKVPEPEFAVFNSSLAKELGMNEEFLKSEAGLGVLSGNKILEGTTPISQAYCGHQFGYFTMLGDGRAVLLGEYVAKDGNRYDVQLKGSGETLYSRGGDGKATLGPMLREYIISEAMNALGVPTTRSLAVVDTGESIIRENILPGAVLTRISKSHIRVGTFQFIAKYGTYEELKQLADYTINRHYSYIKQNEGELYLNFLNEVVRKQAELIAKWQLIGFIHGVMNTDNMAISGETIDYGPCAFMDTYDPNTVFSSIDREGRYAYNNQPEMAAWNLARFAESLLKLLDKDVEKAVAKAQKAVSSFSTYFNEYWINGMRKKLGLVTEEDNDIELINELLALMEKYKADYTTTFSSLTAGNLDSQVMFEEEDFKKWLIKWKERLDRQGESEEECFKLMRKSNPMVIPRNHRVEEALDAAVKNNDYSVMDALLKAVTNPYDYSHKYKEYADAPKVINRCYKTYCGT